MSIYVIEIGAESLISCQFIDVKVIDKLQADIEIVSHLGKPFEILSTANISYLIVE